MTGGDRGAAGGAARLVGEQGAGQLKPGRGRGRLTAMKQITSVSRRRFLRKAAGTAAAAFAGPMIVPASVFGSDEKAPPSERITVGFIGCGKMANDYHLPTLLKF